jgi:hypothetical protein
MPWRAGRLGGLPRFGRHRVQAKKAAQHRWQPVDTKPGKGHLHCSTGRSGADNRINEAGARPFRRATERTD